MRAHHAQQMSDSELEGALTRARARYDKSPCVDAELAFKILTEESNRRVANFANAEQEVAA